MNRCIKCGIKVSPPTFIVLYSAGNKTRKKSIRIRYFAEDANCAIVAAELKEKHQLTSISKGKIEKMLRILQELKKGVDKQNAIAQVEEEIRAKKQSLQKLAARELELQKQEMDDLFQQNQIAADADAMSDVAGGEWGGEGGEQEDDSSNSIEEAADEFWAEMP